MLENLSRRAVIAATALAFAAGCSSSSTSLAPGQSSSLIPSSQRIVAGMRVLPGPAVSGPTIVPLVPQTINAPRGWPVEPARHRRHRQLLFVADGSSGVLIYNPAVVNGSPTGSITTGVDAPAQVAVDKTSSLYVANLGNNTITVYAKGSKSPKLTISSGLSSPYGVTVDSSGEVFASNLGNNLVVGYKAGATSPFETIDFSSLGQPVGLGVDSGDNIWVACDTTSAVFEIPKGSKTPKNAGLSGLNGSIGISFGGSNLTYVSNFGANPSNVQIYTYGTTTPKATITTGIEQNGPTLNGVTHSNAFFQSNQSYNVVGYKLGATTPFSTLKGASSPLGVASSPLVLK